MTMPSIKVRDNGEWKKVSSGGNSVNGGNADTVDGKHASYFASAADVQDLESKVESVLDNVGSAKTLTEHLEEEMLILTSKQCGYALPPAGNKGRIFFLISN
jgi:hypothetical protein